MPPYNALKRLLKDSCDIVWKYLEPSFSCSWKTGVLKDEYIRR